MSPEEKISALDLDIQQTQIELVKAQSCLEKLKDLRHEENVKMNQFDANLHFLRKRSPIVLLGEFSIVNRNKNKLLNDLQVMDIEIQKLERALLSHRKKCDTLIVERNQLLKLNRKGVILEFKRILKK